MFSSAFECEVWFKAVMTELKMLERNPPSLREIKSVLLEHLSKKTHKALRHLKDDSDWSEWLDLSLKIDCLIRLEKEHGVFLGVGVDVTWNREEVWRKLQVIQSHSFQVARSKLGITKHWIVLVNPNHLPGKDWIVDRFYSEVDTSDEIAVLKF